MSQTQQPQQQQQDATAIPVHITMTVGQWGSSAGAAHNASLDRRQSVHRRDPASHASCGVLGAGHADAAARYAETSRG